MPRGLFSVPPQNLEYHVRIIALLLLLTGWIQAIDLTVDSDFITVEDTPVVFSYEELLAKCTVSNGTAVGFKIASLGGNGDILIGTSASGPWSITPVAGTTIFTPGQFIRFAPTANIFGDDVLLMSIRARDGAAVESALARAVNIDITAVDDPITAASHEFVQPGAGPPDYRITEDTLNTWTWQQLKDTLQVNDIEGQPWTLRITGKGSGTLKTAGDVEITSFPTDLAFTALGDVALKWRPPADVYTKTGPPAESALVAFTARAVTTSAPITTSAEVTLTTPVLGVPDPVVAPTATTLGAIAPLVVTRGTTNTFTYEQIHALCSGTNDVDRVGTFSFYFNGSGVDGCTVNKFDSSGNFVLTQSLPSNVGMSLFEGASIQIIVPDSLPTGIRNAGSSTIQVAGSSATVTWVTLSVDVRAAPSGGGTGTTGTSSDSGGGGCGVGAAGLSLVLMFLILSLRLRRISR